MERKNVGYEVLSDEAGRPIKSWTVGVPFEEEAKKQLKNLRGLPFIHKWIAAMPDVHRGYGATVGSVVPTVAPSSPRRWGWTSVAG